MNDPIIHYGIPAVIQEALENAALMIAQALDINDGNITNRNAPNPNFNTIKGRPSEHASKIVGSIEYIVSDVVLEGSDIEVKTTPFTISVSVPRGVVDETA